jgi:tetratricopeptide (TPR) repeat protein
MSRFTFILPAVLLSAFTLLAQNNSDTCQLTVRVRTIQDREYNRPLQVELLSNGGTPISAAQTSGTGSADFMVMSGGIYRVQVSGQGVETTTADVRIPAGQQFYMQTVNVKPSAPTNEQHEAQGSSATISIAEMNVPDKARDELQKGMEAFSKGDMEKAQQRLDKAISIYPKYARAYATEGIIAIKSGDRVKAKALFSKAIEVDDTFVPGYLYLARLEFQDKNYRETESLLRKLMALNPSVPDAVALLASAEYMNKEYDKALADARRTHTLPNHEQFADVHLLAGKILEMENQAQAAIVEYQLFLKESPNSPQVPTVQKEVAQLEAASQ